MRGITEKRLRKWKRIAIQKGLDDLQVSELLDHLLKECEELNPWQPIETAPKDMELLLYEDDQKTKWVGKYNDTIDYTPATHWCELPGNPK